MSTGEPTQRPTSVADTISAPAAEDVSHTVDSFQNLSDREIDQISSSLRYALNNIIEEHTISLYDDNIQPVIGGSDIYQKILEDTERDRLKRAVSMLLDNLMSNNRKDVYKVVVRTLEEKMRPVTRAVSSQTTQPNAGLADNANTQSSVPPAPPPPLPPLPPSQPSTNTETNSPQRTNESVQTTNGTSVQNPSFPKTRWLLRQAGKGIKWTWDKLDYLDIGSEKYILRPPK